MRKTFCHQKRVRKLPTIEWLQNRYTYNEQTGKIGNKYDLFGHQHEVYNRGYKAIDLIHKKQQLQLRSHRLAFALKKSRWPFLIDHKNGIKSDNRWSNLRETNQSINLINTDRSKFKRPSKRPQGYGHSVNCLHKNHYFTKFCDAVNFNKSVKHWYQSDMLGQPPIPIKTKSFRNTKSRREHLSNHQKRSNSNRLIRPNLKHHEGL